MISIVRRLSPAKINLYLEVKSKRRDGYHNIESLMTFCDFGDEISVRKSKNFNLNINGPFSKSLLNKENLIEKSLKKLENFYNRDLTVDVSLTKNLPVASGMGGGSSNAATFILCIIEIFGLDVLEGFDELLLSLGADVPFCFNRKTAIVTGVGEKIFFTKKLQEYFILLINPNIEISTKEIFSNFVLDHNLVSKEKKITSCIDLNSFINKSNDLESYVKKKHDMVAKILLCLSKCEGSVVNRMTGSGATCFALFENINDLNNAEISLKDDFKNCWIKSTKLINAVKYI